MKKMLKATPIALLLLSAAVTITCGGGPSVEEICDRMLECEPSEDPVADRADCIAAASQLQDALRASVWSSMGNCMLDLSCAQWESGDSEDCMNNALANANPDAVDGVLEAGCQLAIDCEQTSSSLAECISQAKLEAGADLAYYGAFKDSVLNCMEDCISQTDCEGLDDAFDVCADDCGLAFGEDAENNGIGCYQGYEMDGACVCDTGWAGTYCDQCAEGYQLDEYGDCVPA